MTKTKNVLAFEEANRQSLVVEGSVLGPPGNPSGCRYRLMDGREFTLARDECAMVELPRWYGVDTLPDSA